MGGRSLSFCDTRSNVSHRRDEVCYLQAEIVPIPRLPAPINDHGWERLLLGEHLVEGVTDRSQ
jgi:hypothetical protein